MHADRREFLKKMGCLTAAGAGLAAASGRAEAAGGGVTVPADVVNPDAVGVLLDTTACVGCRLCEYACKQSNHLECGTLESFSDTSVFKEFRRPSPTSLTVVNEFKGPDGNPIYVKANCLHCNEPGCVSACIVGAMKKEETGQVTYDAWRCIGCRYCMVGCPFQIPTYEYDNVLTPKVQKCELCYKERTSKGLKPACVEACPREAMVWGKRGELVGLAHEMIEKNPKKYVNHVYGEREMGGTSWLYLASVPFDQIGFLKLGTDAPPVATETIQRGIFRYGRGPLGLFALLGAIMLATRPRKRAAVAAGAGKARTISLNVLPATKRGPVEVAAAPAGAAHGVTSLFRAGSAAPVVAEPRFERTSPSTLYAFSVGGSDSAGTTMLEAPASRTRQQASPAVAEHVERPNGNGHANGKAPGHGHAAEHEHEEVPQRVDRKLLTPGVFALLGVMLAGLACAVWRFGWGFASSTNLDQQHPWGLWIGIDVASGVALAAGGFAAATLTSVFHIKRYRPVFRPALLTAMLGYTVVVIGLQADLGRFYNVWHPLVPFMWQGKSVLFTVGICEFLCLNLLYLWFAPLIIDQLDEWQRTLPKTGPARLLARPLAVAGRMSKLAKPVLEVAMPFLIIIGCIANVLHQSALGNLLVITLYKLHPLWHTPILSALFLVSAVGAGGFAMMCWESLFASWCLKLKPEIHVLSGLAKFVPPIMGLYLVGKLADMYVRHTYVYLRHLDLQSVCWMIEVGLGVVVPVAMLVFRRVRTSPWLLFVAATLLVFGIVFNRVNVFIIGYHPPYGKTYIPSVGEFGITLGLMAALMFGYRLAVTYLPIISQPRKGAAV